MQCAAAEVLLTRSVPATTAERWPGVLAAALVLGLLVPVQLLVRPPMLLLERFWTGAGWIEVLLLAVYAGLVTVRMLDPRRQARWRRRIWLLFSAVFFGQLVVGLLGESRMLMNGDLHLPIPAMVFAGPLFRGEGLFMPLLVLSTVLIAGPVWCSHLCYIGAWDQQAAESKRASGSRRRPRTLPGWARYLRWLILLLVAGAAVGLRVAGVPTSIATLVGAGFGVLGVVVMVAWSKRTGTMTHCVVFCPLGLLVNLLGKLSVFRLRIADGCDECGACRRSCRYDALRKSDIRRRRPALSCSLCGDCVGTCPSGQLGFGLAWLREPRGSGLRAVQIAVAIALHAAFLGTARI